MEHEIFVKAAVCLLLWVISAQILDGSKSEDYLRLLLQRRCFFSKIST